VVRSRRILPALVALFAWGCFWATPPPARADYQFQLNIYEDGVLLKSLTDKDVGQTLGSISYSGTVKDFNLQFTYATSNTPGTDGTNGIVTIANTRVTNTTSAAHTLTIAVSSTGFQTNSDALINTASGSVNRGSISGNFTSYVSRDNALFGMSDISTTPVTFSGAAGTGSASFSGTTQSATFAVTPDITYSITNVGNYTFAGNASITLTGGYSETIAPVPSGVVLALSGVPFLGFSCWLRRRWQNVRKERSII
jgi:hypothetical protein